MDDAVAAQVLAEGVAEHADIVASLARSALAAETVKRAAARPHWREMYVGTVVGDQVLEGFIDLVFRQDDDLVIVDYKTDEVPDAALGTRAAIYRPQMAAYAAALTAATSKRVARAVLVFLSPAGAVELTVHGIAEAVVRLRDQIEAG